MITIVDAGTGNLGSILNMFQRSGVDARFGTAVADIVGADKLVLPGVTYKTTFKRLRPLFYPMYRANLVPKTFDIKYTSKNEL